MLTRRKSEVAMVGGLVLLLIAGTVLAQGSSIRPTPTDPGKVLEKNWEEFRHYILIAREDVARSYGQVIAESPVGDRELYLLSEKVRIDEVLSQGEGLSKELAALIVKIRQRISKGFEIERKDPKQIARQIERLGGTVRAFMLATKRLQVSGEYALPQLLRALTDPKVSEDQKERIVGLLPKLGKEVVGGLSEALQTDGPALQEIVIEALGDLGYPHAAARLKELIERKDVLGRVRERARSAIVPCMGPHALNKPAAELLYELADKYYSRAESLRPDGRYKTANVWYWRKPVGLTYVPVAREIFCDVQGMRYALEALKHDASFYPAVSLWVAANLNKEANLPPGATDPTRHQDQPGAAYYALAGSAGFLQDVLGRALNDENSAVAVGAIQALASTAGAKNLVRPVLGGAQPLVRALSYPDRHVRYLAGVTLANALPEKRFTGYSQVLWVLNEALRGTGKKTVLLVVSEPLRRNRLKDAIRTSGYDLIDQDDPRKAMADARKLGLVDLVVLSDKPAPEEMIAAMRADPLLATLPVLCATDAEDLKGLEREDKKTVVVRSDPTPDQMSDALTKALQLGSGKPITEAEAAQWAIRSADAIRNLGLTRNAVYDVSRSLKPLQSALQRKDPLVRVAAGRALGVLKDPQGQQAIAALANDPSIAQDVRISVYAALSKSLRRFGNQLTEELAEGVVEVVKGDGAMELRVAAAQALGAMDLPSAKISSLLLQTAR